MAGILALLDPRRAAALANLAFGDPINIPLVCGGRADATYAYARGFNAALRVGARLLECPDTVVPVPIDAVEPGWLHHVRDALGGIVRLGVRP